MTSFLSALSLGIPQGSYEYIKGWAHGDDIEDEIVEVSIKTADRMIRIIESA